MQKLVTGLWQDPSWILWNTQQSNPVSFLEGLLEGQRKDPLGRETRFMRTKGKMGPRKKLQYVNRKRHQILCLNPMLYRKPKFTEYKYPIVSSWLEPPPAHTLTTIPQAEVLPPSQPERKTTVPPVLQLQKCRVQVVILFSAAIAEKNLSI